MDLAREEGILVPKTEIIETHEDLENWAERVGFPTVLKADGTSGGEGVRMVRTKTEAQQAFRKLQAPPMLARAAEAGPASTRIGLCFGHHCCGTDATVNAQSFLAGHEATSTIACWKGTVSSQPAF